MEQAAAYSVLFAAAFGAATILPFQSEVVFVVMQLSENHAVSMLVLVASVGNILGSGVNYFLGLGIESFRGRKWFPVTDAQLERAQRFYARYGAWTLLLSWAPLGDAFTIIAGMMRLNPGVFLLFVSVAKIGRYLVLAWATARVGGL